VPDLNQPFAIVAAVGVAGFAAWVVKKFMTYLEARVAAAEKERDEAIDGWKSQTAATKELTETLRDHMRADR
jgi:hypothetical protein